MHHRTAVVRTARTDGAIHDDSHNLFRACARENRTGLQISRRWSIQTLRADPQGKLDAVKIGKSARVTTASLKRFVESLPASPGGSPIKRADAPSLEDLGLK